MPPQTFSDTIVDIAQAGEGPYVVMPFMAGHVVMKRRPLSDRLDMIFMPEAIEDSEAVSTAVASALNGYFHLHQQ